MILAFLVVAGSCAIMIPIMLYMFQLHDKGWTWQYAALFGSMLASTDAVAIIATMKSSKCALNCIRFITATLSSMVNKVLCVSAVFCF